MQIEDQQAMSPYLQPNESLQWTGRPPGGLLFRRSDAVMVPFSLAWGGFAVYWEVMAYNSGAPPFFLLFGGIFVVVGLYITVGRFVADLMIRQKTVYAITTERALILSGLFGRTVRSINLKLQIDISLEQRENGRGTITFGSAFPVRTFFATSGWPGYGRSVVPCFELIENVASVYQLIETIRNK